MRNLALLFFSVALISSFSWAAGSKGKLSVETTPSAMVVVDDIPVKQSPLRNLVLGVGTHKLEYKKGSGESVEFQITIVADTHIKCSYNFETTTHECFVQDTKPKKTEGSFEAKSNLPADVTLDGKPIGRTPVSKRKVSPGRHTLVFRSGDLEPVTREFDVNANEHVEVDVNFEVKKVQITE